MVRATVPRWFKILGLAIAAALVLVGGVVLFVPWPAPVPSIRDTWAQQNAVILDSAQVRGSPMAYAFCYDLGALGYSISMASVGEPSHQPGSLVVRYNVEHVWWTAPDTLMVGVQSLNYQLVAPPKGLVVVPTLLAKPGNRDTSVASRLPAGQPLQRVGACVQ